MANRRGSEWSKWDLHIHSPASFHWIGTEKLYRLKDTERDKLLKQMVDALNKTDIAVFAVMDYWTFDGVLALRDFCQRHPNVLKKTVLPGIELRIQAPKAERLDIHAIFSEQIPDQRLRDFLSTLKVQLMNGNTLAMSRDCLIEYARTLRDDQLALHGFKGEQLSDDNLAWKVGSQTCEVTLDSFRQAMRDAPENMAVVFQPWDTYHGLSDTKWQQHYTSAYQLFSQPDIFECKGAGYRAAFLGQKTADNIRYFKGFWAALNERPRLAVRGSDAHEFAKYGKFQSNLTTWIKAAPTFLGLLQAIKEPAARSWLGDTPPKLEKLKNKPTVFIDRIDLRKAPNHSLDKEDWFDGESIPLNPDLVAVIGRKGSGKSALADILGLLGETPNIKSFTFLNPKRFRDLKNNRSQHFEAELIWASGERKLQRLHEDPSPGSLERIRYIPQSYFETVCRGESESEIAQFTQQIEHVIFSYVPSELRGNAVDLPDLLNRQENEANRNLERLRTEVRSLNARIMDTVRRTSSDARTKLEEQLKLRQQQLADLQKVQPPLPLADSDGGEGTNPNVQKLGDLLKQKDEFDALMREARGKLAVLQQKAQAATRLQAGLQNLKTTVEEILFRLIPDAEAIGQQIDLLARLNIDNAALTNAQQRLAEEVKAQANLVQGDDEHSLRSKTAQLDRQIHELKGTLNAQQFEQQIARERLSIWEQQKSALVANSDVPTSIAYVQAQIDWINNAPIIVRGLEEDRFQKTKQIAELLLGIKNTREQLVAKAKDAIHNAISEHNDFSVGFLNELVIGDLEDRFFAHIKQNSGTFRGEDEGRRKFRDIVESNTLESVEQIASVAQILEQATVMDQHNAQTETLNLESLIRKGRTPEEFLNLLYSLDYVKPRFTLALAGQPLSQLSPGQRGALLLVFYLLVEDNDLPIVLDQPEENLDNATVFSLLVQIIKSAKERRQIIMVTHNANLAVCCDAEQIVHASHDKGNGYKVAYVSGPIEDPAINRLVVDVLEGTRPAFDNRSTKYHTDK